MILDRKGFISLLKGMGTYLPGITIFVQKKSGATVGTSSARYCYSVWLRHLVIAYKNGFLEHPKVVAELGPGDSLGIGLSALISGADAYYGLDVIEFANKESNMEIFDDLVELFLNKSPIPDDKEFPRLKPFLDSYEFPNYIFGDNYFKTILSKDRLDKIRDLIKPVSNCVSDEFSIKYIVPWDDEKVILKNSVDMIISQAVLEHVNDLDESYIAMHKWLKPGGFMSHEIDFKCHRISTNWDCHWTYSDFIWKLIMGKRKYFLNRHPYSVHINSLENSGFKIICDIKNNTKSSIKRKNLAKRFIGISDDDLTTSEVFIQAIHRS